jgi:hypothetical protein
MSNTEKQLVTVRLLIVTVLTVLVTIMVNTL